MSNHSSLYKTGGWTPSRTDRPPLKVSQFMSFISRRRGGSLMNNAGHGHLPLTAQSRDWTVFFFFFLADTEYFKHCYNLKPFVSILQYPLFAINICSSEGRGQGNLSNHCLFFTFWKHIFCFCYVLIQIFMLIKSKIVNSRGNPNNI